MDMDGNGDLWVATKNTGFMKFDGSKWTNFTRDIYPDIMTNSYRRVKAHPNGSVFLSSWGAGMLVVNESGDGYEFEHFDHENSPFGDLGDGFVVVNDCEIDASGRAWFANYGGQTPGPMVVTYNTNKEFGSYDNPLAANKRYFWQLAIDQWGTKWLGALESYGLMYFNENNTPDMPEDDIYGIITTSTHTEMLENRHSALAVDQLGMVWIGTDYGINVVFNPYSVLSGSEPIIRKLRLIENIKINDIMVDALNNKWVATNAGVWVLNPDGTESLTENPITTANSPLPTNEVVSLFNDEFTGDIYLGTNQGLYVVNSLSVMPAPEYNISCYPQPFNPNRHSEMIIEGLAPDSDLRITTTNGELIRKIKTTSRKTIWDGTDESGEDVSTGVYLIIATSETLDANAVAKIAVIRR
jgi:hypothetical protein